MDYSHIIIVSLMALLLYVVFTTSQFSPLLRLWWVHRGLLQPQPQSDTGPLPNDGKQTGQCQDLCNKQTDCNYWSIYCPPLAIEHCNCTLYEHSYLHSCQKIGGDKDTAIEVSLMGDHFQIKKWKAFIPSQSLRSLLFSLKNCGKVKVNCDKKISQQCENNKNS